ncbi:unnamed protein product, partial [Nesidiocoris tenuis]
MPEFRVILGSIYLPSYLPVNILESYLSQLESVSLEHPDFRIVIIGDFNLPGICPESWNDDDRIPIQNEKSRLLFTSLRLFNLRQYNYLQNQSGNVLDLCLSSIEMKVMPAIPIVPADPSHPPLEGTLVLSRSSTHHPTQQLEFNFKKGDYQSLESYLSTIDWTECTSLPLDGAVARFYEIVHHAIGLYVPRTRPFSNNYPKWFSPELIHLVTQKRQAHARYKQSSDPLDYSCFSDLRSRCCALSRSLYRSYVDNVQCSMLTDVKAFWNFVNYSNGHNSFPSLMTFEGRSSRTMDGIAELFATYFSSVYDPPVLNDPSYPESNLISLSSLSVSLQQVQRELASLDPSKGMGPDGVPPLLLKHCPSMAIPLTSLFNKSLEIGSFPQVWKTAFLTPIHKSGSKSVVSHYRPISTLSTIPKMFEKLVLAETAPLIYPTITPNQHGFIPGRSTVTNLLSFQEYVLSAFEAGCPQVDCVYTDFSKAFDKLSHKHVLAVLRAIGLRGALFSWLSDYLQGRTMRVRLRGVVSRHFGAPSGVPQGSHIGPLLFLLLINTIAPELQEVQFLLYADDLKVFTKIESDRDTACLQQSINKVLVWCSNFHLSLNIPKCFVVSYRKTHTPVIHPYVLGGAVLNRTEVARDLGVLFDSRLAFGDHVGAIVVRAMRALGFLKRTTREFSSIPAILLLYKTMVRPVMEYASVVWSPCYETHKNELERVQSKFLRYLAFKSGKLDAYSPGCMLADHGLGTLARRRVMHDTVLLHKIISPALDCPSLLSKIFLNVPTYFSRQPPLFHVPFATTNYLYHRPLYRLPRQANLLLSNSPEIDIFHSSVSSIKTA